MNKTEIMQQIKQDIMTEQECTTDQAVRFIADILGRSPSTVYEYLSNNRPDIPEQSLRLLQLELKE